MEYELLSLVLNHRLEQGALIVVASSKLDLSYMLFLLAKEVPWISVNIVQSKIVIHRIFSNFSKCSFSSHNIKWKYISKRRSTISVFNYYKVNMLHFTHFFYIFITQCWAFNKAMFPVNHHSWFCCCIIQLEAEKSNTINI